MVPQMQIILELMEQILTVRMIWRRIIQCLQRQICPELIWPLRSTRFWGLRLRMAEQQTQLRMQLPPELIQIRQMHPPQKLSQDRQMLPTIFLPIQIHLQVISKMAVTKIHSIQERMILLCLHRHRLLFWMIIRIILIHIT